MTEACGEEIYKLSKDLGTSLMMEGPPVHRDAHTFLFAHSPSESPPRKGKQEQYYYTIEVYVFPVGRHPSQEVKPGTLNKMLKMAGINK